MKKTLLAVAIAAATASAQADVKVSGHVNYMLVDKSDFTGKSATQENLRVEGNGNSGSRFRIVATKDANGITWGVKEEVGLSSSSLSVRKSELWAKGDFGKVSIGQGSEAGDDLAEQDFSGTYVLTGGNAIGAGVHPKDGGRTERLRYDSPKLGGIATIQVSYNETETNLGLHLNAGNIMAGIYTQSNSNSGKTALKGGADELGASVAAKFGDFTAALKVSSVDASKTRNVSNYDEQTRSQVIVGYRTGAYSVAVDFGDGENDTGATTKLEMEHVGLSFVYRPAKGVELYAGVRSYEEDDSNAATVDTDGTAYALGARVKF